MLQIIKCPSCAAPLEFDGDRIETCEFCGSRVVMTPDNAALNETSFGFGNLLGQAHKLKEILHLARSGSKIHAIKLYRETFGVGLAEAKDAVEKLERGESVSFQNVNFQSYEPIKIDARAAARTAKAAAVPSLLIVGIILLVVTAFVGAAVYSVVSGFDSARRSTVISPPPAAPQRAVPSAEKSAAPTFAREVLRFGGEGVGAGMFTDNRVVAVDPQGKIYSVDYIGGRVQVFDAAGKFQTQWFIDKEFGVFGFEAGRSGTIYLIQRSEIAAYEAATGKLIKKTARGSYEDLAVGLDGGVTAIDGLGTIYRFDKDLNQLAVFKDAAKTAGITSGGGFEYVAVNGLGEIFAAARDGKDICKFSADGKFVDRFKTKAMSANDLAVDPKGRVFVSDTNQIYVYSPEGEFVNQFETRQSFGMTFNDQGEIFVASRPFVVKYQLQD